MVNSFEILKYLKAVLYDWTWKTELQAQLYFIADVWSSVLFTNTIIQIINIALFVLHLQDRFTWSLLNKSTTVVQLITDTKQPPTESEQS